MEERHGARRRNDIGKQQAQEVLAVQALGSGGSRRANWALSLLRRRGWLNFIILILHNGV
ncbi:hypothetical protein [Moorella sp. Hama-1]|uniref:hypothetical protein n=1 Tax=Moorella sp. Hama-1 TaxID=2138101 RepID=UPI000D65DE06|nr:hypothetical protein [Moorella sp. Hama-1]BCV23107.1 hypothetical protein hamaS1_31760 [Moorella sp. Hama-1]